MSEYRVNVSSVQDFMQCRFRWWCKWVKNRVPVATSPALDAGKILHRAFERADIGGNLSGALALECKQFRAQIPEAHPATRPSAYKAVVMMEDLIEAMDLWQDRFPITKVLEVEAPFTWTDPVLPGLVWLGRPDRVVLCNGRIWHQQRRGLAAGMNFGMYLRLAQRHYHEHLYAYPLMKKYKRLKLPWGGTIFDLVRKLKFRTNSGKKNEAVKTAEEMFRQDVMSVNLQSPLHKSVMMSLRQHVVEMLRTEKEWNEQGLIPAPNEKMNGGFAGNSDDPYFRLLIGEIKLDDEAFFKDREDLYTSTPDMDGG